MPIPFVDVVAPNANGFFSAVVVVVVVAPNANGFGATGIAADAGNVAEVARLLALKADGDLADNYGLVAPRHVVQIQLATVDRLIMFLEKVYAVVDCCASRP